MIEEQKESKPIVCHMCSDILGVECWKCYGCKTYYCISHDISEIICPCKEGKTKPITRSFLRVHL